MPNDMTIHGQSGLVPNGFSTAQLKIMRQTVAKDCNPAEFDVFIETAKSYGLNPFRREIYAIVVSKDKPDKRQLVLVTGIDGFRRKAEQSGDYAPSEDEPEYTYAPDLKDPKVNPLGIEKCKVTVFKGTRKVVGVAYWDEFAPIKEVWAPDPETNKWGPTGRHELDPRKEPWWKMPRHMIAKCAEAQALRKGWPATFSGLFVAEEMDQATVDLSPSEWVEREAKEDREKRIGHGKSAPFVWKVGDSVEMVPMGQIADRINGYLRSGVQSSAELEWWKRTNAEGMRSFWADAPNDALEIKKSIETRRDELNAAEQQEAVQ